MARFDLNLVRVGMFECIKEKDNSVVNCVGNRIINLEKPKDSHLQLISILKHNIKKKIIGLEAEDASKRLKKTAAIEEFNDISLRGAPPIAMVLPLEDKEQQKQLEIALDSNNDVEFRKICSQLGVFYVNESRVPKGIVGFVQFNFQLSRKTINRFLGILMTKYSTEILTIDDKSLLKYLTTAFSHNFLTTMIYPHLIKEKIPTTKGIKPKTKLGIDKSKIKIHTKTKDPAIFDMVGTPKPRDPQKNIEKIYKEKLSEIKDIKELKEHVAKKDLKESVVTVKVGDDISFNVDLDTFNEKFEMFISKLGSGILVKEKNIEVYLGKRNLLTEQKIKFKSVRELFKDDYKEGTE